MAVIDTTLAKYIFETTGLLETADLIELKGITLGVDVLYLNEILYQCTELNSSSTKDNFNIISTSFLRFIEKLATFEIKPYFVLPGLKNFNQYKESLGTNATQTRNTPKVGCEHLLHISSWINLFSSKGFSFIVAPYSPLTQLTYLLSEDIIDAIFGSSELLMFNKINRVILNFNLMNESVSDNLKFQFIDKYSLFKNINTTNHLEFTELLLILKNNSQPTTYSIPKNIGKNFKDTVNVNKNTSLKLTYLSPSQQELLEKALLTLYAAPIFHLNGTIQIYNFLNLELTYFVAENQYDSAVSDEEENEELTYDYKYNKEMISPIEPPADSYEFLGKRLPDEIVFYQSIGMFDRLNTVLEGIVYGTCVESVAFDNMSLKATTVEKLEKLAFNIKQKETKLIVNCMTRYFHKQKINYENKTSNYSKHFDIETLHVTDVTNLKKISFMLESKKTTSVKDFFSYEFQNKTFSKLSVGKSFDNVESLFMSVFWRVFAYFFNIASDIDANETFDTITLMNSKNLKFIEKIAVNVKTLERESEVENFIAINLLVILLDLNSGDDLTFISYKLLYQIKLLLKECFETVLVWSLLTGDFQRLSYETVSEWQQELISKLPFQKIDDYANLTVQTDDCLTKLITLL
ncbi:hypothetical protein QEN19_004335 [Hanseniaspora menglaensis]